MKKLVRLFPVILFCFTILGCVTAGAPGQTAIPAVPLENDPAIVSGVLENGFSYRILRNNYPENRIFLRLVVKIGSVLEDSNERGIAHLVEHMSSNGSTHFPEHEMDNYFESLGMSIGPDINAFTWFDETVYWLEIPADNPEALAMSLTAISDWASGLSFDEVELERERGVVLEEWRLGRGINGRVGDALLPFLLPFSRYANRDPIGKPDIIRKAPRDRIVNFYKKWYRPELMTLVVVGDVDGAGLEKVVREQFSAIPPGKGTRPEYGVSVPKMKRSLFLQDPEAYQPKVYMGSTFPVLKARTQEDYRRLTAVNLARYVLGARLWEQLENSGALRDAQTYTMELTNSMIAEFVCFIPVKGKFTESFCYILDEVDRFVQFGVTESELERHKVNLRSTALDIWQNREKRESKILVDTLVEGVINNVPLLSPDGEYWLALDTINTLTVDEVNQVIRDYYSGRGSRLAVIAPPDAELPSKRTVENIWKNYRNPSLAPYREDLDSRPLFPPELAGPGGAVTGERVLNAGTGGEPAVTEFTLSNGAKVVVCPTDFQKDAFVFNGIKRGGLSLLSDELYPSAAYAAYYAGTSGLNGFKQTEVTKKLAGTVVAVGPVLDQVSAGLQGSAAARDMETFFQLVNLYFTAPNFSAAAWDRMQRDLRANFESTQNYPDWLIYVEMEKFIYRGSPRFIEPDLQFLDQMEMARAEESYRQFYRDAGNFTFIFTGDIDIDEVKRLSALYLGSLPSGGERTEAKDRFPPFPEGKPVVRIEKGIEQQGMVRIYFGGDNPEIEGDVLTEQELVSAMTQLAEIRLREQIREKMGASYGFDVYCEQRNYPARRYDAQIVFGCDPARAEELAGAVIEELRAIVDSPVSETELVKLREAFIRKRETDLKTNEFWQGVLTANYTRGDESARHGDAEKVLAALNAETIQKLTARYFNRDNYVIGILLPSSVK